MKNESKKSVANLTDLRATADAAVATWRAAEKAREEATTAWVTIANGNPGVRGKDHGLTLAKVLAERRHHEAEGAAHVAAANAGRAVDDLEAAEGDALAQSISAGHIASELAEDAAKETRLRAELEAVRARQVQRLESTTANLATLAARRKASDLPPPAQHPRLERAMGGEPLTIAQWAEAYSIAAASPPRPRPTNTEQIRRLTMEERDTRVAIERAHRAAEKEAKERQEAEERHAQQKVEDAKRASLEHAEWAAKMRANQDAEEELIAAQKARSGV